jgi:hypothetical protein
VPTAGVDVVRLVRNRKRDCPGERRPRRNVPDQRRLAVSADPEEPLDACPDPGHQAVARLLTGTSLATPQALLHFSQNTSTAAPSTRASACESEYDCAPHARCSGIRREPTWTKSSGAR